MPQQPAIQGHRRKQDHVQKGDQETRRSPDRKKRETTVPGGQIEAEVKKQPGIFSRVRGLRMR